MAWKIDTKVTGSLSDGATKLPAGTNTYKIVTATQVPDKTDPKGKALQVQLGLALGERTYKVFLSVESAKEIVAEIALKTLRDFFVASGITGQIKSERLPSLVGKTVQVEVVENAGKGENAGKTYSNIASVEPVEGGEKEEDDDEDEEEAPPAKKGKTKPAPAPEPEDEDEDEDDEDEDDEEEETPPPAKAGKKKKKDPWD
jgi:hypothetical protein